MEKYAVDLDKVLDEFEFSEDRAERLANTPGRKSSTIRTPHIIDSKIIPPARHYRRPAFEPIDLADADFAPAASTLDSHESIPESQKDFTNDDLNNISNEVNRLWQSGRDIIICENSHNILNGKLKDSKGYVTIGISEAKTENENESDTDTVCKASEDLYLSESFLNHMSQGQEKFECQDCPVNTGVTNISLDNNSHDSATLLCDISSSESSVGDNISVQNSDIIENHTMLCDNSLREDNYSSNDLIDSSRSEQMVNEYKGSLHDLTVLPLVPVKLETDYVNNETNCISNVEFSDIVPNSNVFKTETHLHIPETATIGFNEMDDISEADCQQYLEELDAEDSGQPPVTVSCTTGQSPDSYTDSHDGESVKLLNKNLEESFKLNEHCHTDSEYSASLSHEENVSEAPTYLLGNRDSSLKLSHILDKSTVSEICSSSDGSYLAEQENSETVENLHDINMNNTLTTEICSEEDDKSTEKHNFQISHHNNMAESSNTDNTVENNSEDKFIPETKYSEFTAGDASSTAKTLDIIHETTISKRSFNNEIYYTNDMHDVENLENLTVANSENNLMSDSGQITENLNGVIFTNNANHLIKDHDKMDDSTTEIITNNSGEIYEDTKIPSVISNTSHLIAVPCKVDTSKHITVTNDSGTLVGNAKNITVINNYSHNSGKVSENTNNIIASSKLISDSDLICENTKCANDLNQHNHLTVESSKFVENTELNSVMENTNNLMNNSEKDVMNTKNSAATENVTHLTGITGKVGPVNNGSADNIVGMSDQTNNINNLIIDYSKVDKNSKHLSLMNTSLHSGEIVDNINDQISISCASYSSSDHGNMQGLENNHGEESHDLPISGDDGNNNNGISASISNFTTDPMLECRGSSEIRSCMVRTPKDGNVINVMGEEEKPSRPKFLALSTQTSENEHSQNAGPSFGSPGETPFASHNPEDNALPSSPDISESSIEQAVSPVLTPTTPDVLTPEDRNLGKIQPFWVPDSDAPNCMLCDFKFTLVKRRHHCRACGKVLCSKCCNLKSRLEYMDNVEARVCQPCSTVLTTVASIEQGQSATGSPSIRHTESGPIRRPNPNNPMEYCSTIPPLEQAANMINQPPPTVLVPVGVLKREGSTKSKNDVTKQVMFSDGIRPGGDLTELDGSCEPRPPYRRPGRVQKRVGTPPGSVPVTSQSTLPKSLPSLDPKTMSYVPADKGLPPLVTPTFGEPSFDAPVLDNAQILARLDAEDGLPLLFAINKNYFIHVKKLSLDCCVNRTCWSFTSVGLCTVGQDEVVLILECLPDEKEIPRDVFLYFNGLYQDASRGNTFTEFGYTPIQSGMFLGSADHGGFIYIRPTFQCLQKLMLPHSAYLVAILIHRWETSWARVFPIRLMLRLGAEFRYYPCMLVSVRHRSPVYYEIGHTIMNLLNDFRNLSYTLPAVRGLVIHMEDRQTSVLIPKNRYDQVTRALNNSNDPVLAIAGNFSPIADSHLVCIQVEEDETYRTQAINIHNKPRKVTGASFVVFNGALKSTTNLTAKSSIVEDGLMVQISPETMQALRTALRNMKDYTIGCGPVGAATPDETVLIKWVGDDKNFNIGVKSEVDGCALDGIPSIRVHNGTDYVGGSRFIRWTEVFILQQCDDEPGRNGDPADVSRLSESIARATCLALVKFLDLLAQAEILRLSVRATIHPENVGYEAGSNSEKLPAMYMDGLDNELVPILHEAASSVRDGPATILELVFHIMLQ